MHEQIKLSIVIPAYREEKRIHIILEAVEKYVKSKPFPTETIIVVDASPDNTAQVAKQYADRIPSLTVFEGKENRGKGGAVQDGVRLARGEYVVFADADNSTPIEQVDKLLEYIDQYDLVIGSRYCPKGKLAIPQSLTRRMGSRVLNSIIQLLAVPGIKDTQCGFKLFKTEVAKDIFKRETIYGFSFDIEILAIARILKYKVKEEGIIWYDNPHSTVSPIKDGLRMIGDAWQIRKNIVKKIY